MDIERLTDRVLQVAKTFDPSTRLPLVVIDSTALPPPRSDLYTQLVNSIINRLPNSPYAMLFFACGAPNKPSWSWIAKTYSMLERRTKKQVRKLYIVHESWWVRAVIEMLHGVVSSKFKSKIIHVSNLTQLAQMIDITLINIHPLVYLHDRKVEDQITIPRHHTPIFGMQVPCINNQFHLPQLWKDGIAFLKVTAPVTRGVFRRTEDPELLYILRDGFDRNQLLDLDDYGPLMTASVLKLWLFELPTPVIPLKSIKLPIVDSADYCSDLFRTLPKLSQRLLTDLVSVLHSVSNSERTQQSAASLGACVGPTLIGSSDATTKDNVAIASRFVRNLVQFWPKIYVLVQTKLDPPSQMMMPPPRRQLSETGGQPNIYSIRNNSSPELHNNTSNSNPMLIDLPPSPQSPTFNLNQPKTSMPPPPPPPPKKTMHKPRASSGNAAINCVSATPPVVPEKPSRVLQPSNVINIDSSEEPVQQQPPPPPTPMKKAPVRRGKMVAELARLYEEKSQSAQILVELQRSRP